MKKLLLILSSFAVSTTSTASIVACTNKNDDFISINSNEVMRELDSLVNSNKIKPWTEESLQYYLDLEYGKDQISVAWIYSLENVYSTKKEVSDIGYVGYQIKLVGNNKKYTGNVYLNQFVRIQTISTNNVEKTILNELEEISEPFKNNQKAIEYIKTINIGEGLIIEEVILKGGDSHEWTEEQPDIETLIYQVKVKALYGYVLKSGDEVLFEIPAKVEFDKSILRKQTSSQWVVDKITEKGKKYTSPEQVIIDLLKIGSTSFDGSAFKVVEAKVSEKQSKDTQDFDFDIRVEAKSGYTLGSWDGRTTVKLPIELNRKFLDI